ncbi:DNA polymerase IV [Streptomyces sp. Ru87]|uniref:DNA polymerase IV n=1 Tax=Streptomyces sp. Ru87 TaxID=2044307 RepID=UPI0015D4AA40|nr:DNA polymerase IV [Streptomyces sp. Ru87]
MRAAPTILHLDMDAFFAAAEQAAKPSLRGKPVVVGGLGPRGVVATASYEARVFGVHSAMSTAQARRLCPNAAYLTPRFSLYRQLSDAVMELLRELSPLVEPLSLDEAFVDLEAGGVAPTADAVRAVGERLRADIRAATSLTGSVGLAASKMLAKMASEQAKPDGLVLIEPGTERQLLAPMPVRALPGVGPATAAHLRRSGIGTVAELEQAGEEELVRLLGKAHGAALAAMAAGRDDRAVVAERDAKSVSVEDTFDVDLHDRVRVYTEVARLAERCVERLRGAGRSGRTVVLKVRRYDFSTLTRSETLRGPTDDPAVVREAAARLLDGVDTTGGVRLLGVGVSGLASFTQEDLFAQAATERAAAEAEGAGPPAESPRSGEPGPAEAAGADAPDRTAGPADPEQPGDTPRRWFPGHDVHHAEHGPGWVQGSGLGRVTVRFERPGSPPGRVLTFAVDDPELRPADPLPLVPAAEGRPSGPPDPPSAGPERSGAADETVPPVRPPGTPGERPGPPGRPSGAQEPPCAAPDQPSDPAIRPKPSSPGASSEASPGVAASSP